MDLLKIITTIYEGLVQLIPMFRMVWVGTVVLGAAMLIIALILRKNPSFKKSPWIVGGIGLLMVISSGTQLLMSLI